MTWHLLYLWNYMHCIWHLTHDLWYHNTLSITSVSYISYLVDYTWQHIHCISVITPDYQSYNPHCMYDNTGTICMNVSTDITPTFVWHHTHYMCDIICTLYNTILTPYVITLLYLWYHSLYIWNHIQYVGPHIHYTCDITATNWCHNSHSIDNIRHTLNDITLG